MKENIIKISNLTKQYSSNGYKAVDDISFEVKTGELFAFLGVNGAGKSTTINILCTLLKMSSGEVEVCGFNLKKNVDKVKNNIGVVFQNGVLDDTLTVYDNLLLRGALFGTDKNTLKRRIDNLSKRLSMTEFINRPYGKLSGGQKRKSDIARALISNPKILFLDEPTTGLDPQSRADMWQVIKDIKTEYDTTVFLTTHYMEEVNGADRVAIIDKGKLLCIDTPENLKTQYSYDMVRLTPKEQDFNEVEKALQQNNIKYSLYAKTFVIHIKNGIDLIDLIAELKRHLLSVEIIKGDMDSVFLNVVGRRFSHE